MDVFAKDYADIPNAIKAERSVAIDRADDNHYRAVGKFRYAKYARYLMWEYYPVYTKLCIQHANALKDKDTLLIKETENRINDFKLKFFNI